MFTEISLFDPEKFKLPPIKINKTLNCTKSTDYKEERVLKKEDLIDEDQTPYNNEELFTFSLTQLEQNWMIIDDYNIILKVKRNNEKREMKSVTHSPRTQSNKISYYSKSKKTNLNEDKMTSDSIIEENIRLKKEIKELRNKNKEEIIFLKLEEEEKEKNSELREIKENYKNKVAEAERDYNRIIAEPEKDYNSKLAEAEKTYYSKLAIAEKSYYSKLAIAEKTFITSINLFQMLYGDIVKPIKNNNVEFNKIKLPQNLEESIKGDDTVKKDLKMPFQEKCISSEKLPEIRTSHQIVSKVKTFNNNPPFKNSTLEKISTKNKNKKYNF